MLIYFLCQVLEGWRRSQVYRSDVCQPIRASDLHELTDSEQVGQSDVITAEEGLSAEKHGLQFLQSVVELRECTIQTHLVHLRAGVSREQHLRQVEVETGGGGDTERETDR